MNILEAIKLETGTRVKIADSLDSEVWIVRQDDTLRLEGPTSVDIEQVYPLCYISAVEFERCDEQLPLQVILCEERLGHRIKRVGDDSTTYVVIRNYAHYLDLLDMSSSTIRPKTIWYKHFATEVLNSLYIDLGKCEGLNYDYGYEFLKYDDDF